MTEGSFQTTNNPLDIAIEGSGFLRVGAGTPPAKEPYTTGLPAKVKYTRAGDLTTNSQGFLTTEAGEYVIGRNAVATETEAGTTYAAGKEDSYIQIPPGSSNVSIGQDGSVTYTDENPESKTYQQRVTAGYISLATFPNEAGLERLGGSLWGQTANSGSADRRHSRHPRLRLDDRRGARDVERRPCHRDDQHDHRRAWLSGQLARDLHSRRNARDAGHDGAVGRRSLSEADRAALDALQWRQLAAGDGSTNLTARQGGRSRRTTPRSTGWDGARNSVRR